MGDYGDIEQAIAAGAVICPDTYKEDLAILMPGGREYAWDFNPTIKLYCVISLEAIDKMNGSVGKLNAQGGHAWLHAYWDAEQRFSEVARAYRKSNAATKITLLVPLDEDLVRLHDAYQPICGVSLVIDRGHTVFNGPTMTCLGIGPLRNEDKGPDLDGLKSLNGIKGKK
jgi:peptidyl-tRNA hydrolase